MDFMNWIAPIVVAVVGGLFSYLGVSRTAKAAHDKEVSENAKQIAKISEQIGALKEDIKRLEQKQDKHNAVIERTFKLEQHVDDLERRIS